MDPKKKDEWKRSLFERVKEEVFKDLDWDLFSQQVDHFCHVFGGGLYREGKIPPHGRNEIWLPGMLEREIIKEFKKAVEREQG